MCYTAIWAAVLAYGASYGVKDQAILDGVADAVVGYEYQTPSELQAALFQEFDKRGIHMV